MTEMENAVVPSWNNCFRMEWCGECCRFLCPSEANPMEGCDEGESKVKVGICWQLSDGRYLSGRDSDFIDRVLEDIQSFNEKGVRDRSANDNRSACSGMGIEQRGSDCHEVNVSSIHSGRKKARMLPDVAIYQPPALRRTSQGTEGGMASDKNPKQSKQRRPDLAVYVPRALRGLACPQKNVSTVSPRESKAERVCQSHSRVEETEGSMALCRHAPTPAVPSSTSPQALPTAIQACEQRDSVANECVEEGIVPRLVATRDEGPSVEGGMVEACPRRDSPSSSGACGDGAVGRRERALEQTMARGNVSGGRQGDADAESCGAPETGGEVTMEEGVGHWEEHLVVEEVEGGRGGRQGLLVGELVDEVVAAVGRVSVVEKPRSDYGQYRMDDVSLSLAELTHVVEVFGFPAEFKTHDLVSILSTYGGGPGFEIKWVDDTHALAVFGSSFVAADVLNLRHPMLKTRALEEASAASKAKARKLSESLRVPYRPRPETCAALAQRLITGALGVQHRQSKAEREEERRLLREAREKRRSAARERDAAWEGTIGGTLL